MPRGDTELSGDQKFVLNLVDRIVIVVMFGIKAVITLGITFGIVYAVAAISQHGVKTDINVSANANIAVHLFSVLESRAKWAWGIAVFAILYGIAERQLRRRKTAYLQGRIVKLEEMIDQHRSSSGLSERGETRTEDK